MLRSYRNIVFALVGWLSLTAQHPNPPAKPQQTEAAKPVSNASQNVAPSKYELAERTHRAKYEAECDPANEKRDSDLCAQWKAADATTNSAYWTYVGNWIGGISGLLVLVALGFAFEANRISRETAKRQLRAYVAVELASYRHETMKGPPIVEMMLANSGQTPAYEFTASGKIIYSPDGVPEMPADLQFTSQSILGPSISLGLRIVTDADWTFESQFGQVMYVVGTAQYTDAFGARWATEFTMCANKNPGELTGCLTGNRERSLPNKRA